MSEKCCDDKLVLQYSNVISIIDQVNGWLPVFALVPHDDGVVLTLIDYINGEGRKPELYVGWYMGDGVWVQDINDALVFGEKGDKGNNGDSAYVVAVLNGFIGTEEEWLESLKQPAIDAAEEATRAAENADSKATLANDATTAANTATTAANSAAGSANSAATSANNAATGANTARDGANSAATNANNKAALADAATIAANQATTNTNTAITGANTARDAANLAATNANSKATLAQTAAADADSAATAAGTATGNAITATTNANNAAAEARAQRGWSADTVFEEHDGKLIKRLDAWIGGTGAIPTEHVGEYYTDLGGFTSDKDLAVDFKGDLGDSIININPDSPVQQARIWIGTQGQYDAQQPLATDALIFIKR